MSSTQLRVDDGVISFEARAALLRAGQEPPEPVGACLTALDRIDITRWQDAARDAGYDRMVIHDRDFGDSSDVGTFLSVYSRGKAWSRWGFARRGARILAWCCLSGADVGEFSSLSQALETVLLGEADTTRLRPDRLVGNIVPVARSDYAGAAVTVLHLKRKAFGRTVGSAA